MLIRGSNLTFDAMDAGVIDDGEDRLRLDLERTRFIDAYGLVVVACLVEDAELRGMHVELTPPRSRDCGNYMARMHLPDVLESAGFTDHALPTVGERSLPTRLVEVTPFESSSDVTALAQVVYGRLSDSYRTRLIASELYESLIELGANVLEHADRDRGFVAAQVYNRGKPNQYIVFAIGDAGIGIRQSLASAGYNVPDDRSAVELALEHDVSASREPGRGQGLPSVSELLGSVAGRVLVRTGRAKVIPRTRRHHGQQVSQVRGTVVAAHVACGAGR